GPRAGGEGERLDLDGGHGGSDATPAAGATRSACVTGRSRPRGAAPPLPGAHIACGSPPAPPVASVAMLDLRRIRTEPEAVIAALDRRGPGTSDPVKRVVELDAEHRRGSAERDEVRGRVQALSKEAGRLRGQGRQDEDAARMREGRPL